MEVDGRVSEHGELEALRGARLGSCVLEQPLGFGGMGAVYLARQERPHRQVAVKVLRPQGRVEPEAWRVFLARFRLEADATAALDHANIVPIYEFGEAGDLAYLVMPYLPGGSLASLIASEGPLPVARAIDFCGQIAAALDYAHEHGVIHRDVKPSNLLRHPDGRLLLADFGIARLTERGGAGGTDDGAFAKLTEYSWDGGLTQTGSAMGTPEYMAPEQVRGDAAGAAADIYALGIVTYVMLAATSPFAGGDINTVLRRQLVEPPMPLRPLRPDVTPRVEEVIFWSLAKDARDRPKTAGEFARALLTASRSRTLGGLPSWRSQTAGRQGAATQVPPRTASAGPRPMLLGTLPMRGPSSPRLSAAGPMRSASAPTSSPAPPDDATIAALSPSSPGRVPPLGGAGLAAGAPLWPVDPDRRPRPAGRWSATRKAGIIALVAACVALALVATLVLSALGNSSLSGGSPSARGAAHPLAHATATATATPIPTPTATPVPENWLIVMPGVVKLGCQKSNKSATVALYNQGSAEVQWSASLSDSNYSLGIVVTPTSGSVRSGSHVNVTLTNRSWFGDKGTVTFTASDANAGSPAAVSVTTAGCVGHG